MLLKKELIGLEQFHQKLEANDRNWAKPMECSCISLDMLQSIQPPNVLSPYIKKGFFYPKALYGNEWIINKYLLYQYGITLIGPDF